jgi:CPA2 family monovalent cation:H+ antiporter-2
VELGRRPRLRYGPTGRTLTRLLKDHDVEPTVIELNADTTRRLRDEGVRAVDGDAAHRATLEAVRVLTAPRTCVSSTRCAARGPRLSSPARVKWRWR